MVKNLILESLIGRICKLLDKRSDVLSFQQYLNAYADKTSHACLFQKFEKIREKAKNIIQVRHEVVSHKNKDVVIGLKHLPEVRVSDIEEVVEVIDILFADLRSAVYPSGVIGSDGNEVVIARFDRARAYTKKLLEKIKRANESR